MIGFFSLYRKGVFACECVRETESPWFCVGVSGCVFLCLLGLLGGHEKAEAHRKVTDPGMGRSCAFLERTSAELKFGNLRQFQ